MRKWLIVAALLALLALAVFRNAPDPVPLARGPYLTIFLVDGLSNEVFQSERAAGNLPHLDQLIADGTFVENGITSFPSVSGYAHYPYLTGKPATESELFGLRWFDRARENGNFRNYVGRTNPHMDADLASATPTIFEQAAPDPSVAYNSTIDRGVETSVTLGLDFVLSKYTSASGMVRTLNGIVQIYNFVPKLGLARDVATNAVDVERKVVDLALERMAADRVQLLVFSTPDNVNHLDGYRSDSGFNPDYLRQVRLIDELVGRYRAHSVATNAETERTYLFAADHSINHTTKNISVVKELSEQFGMITNRDRAVRRNLAMDMPLSAYVDDSVEIIEALQGNNMAFYYLRDPALNTDRSWRSPISPDQLHAYPVRGGADTLDVPRAVVSLEGVQLVAYKGDAPQTFQVRSKHGRAEIVDHLDGRFSYRVLEDGDPLQYGLPGDTTLHEDEWLALTYRSNFPYGVPFLGKLGTAHPDADLIVTSEDGYDHGLDFEALVGNYRGSHGGIDRKQTVVPFILTGPRVQAGRVLPFARAEDMGSTVQFLMGWDPGRPDRVLREILRPN